MATNNRQAGLTYIGMLLLVVFIGIALGAVADLWSTTRKREKEEELLYIGSEFRQAIQQYYENTPGGVKQYPKSLESLLRDSRFLTTRRYLRKIYFDPMTNSSEWGLMPSFDGGIMGIYSLSTAKPLKVNHFNLVGADFNDKTSYEEWKFVYEPATPPPKLSNGGS